MERDGSGEARGRGAREEVRLGNLHGIDGDGAANGECVGLEEGDGREGRRE